MSVTISGDTGLAGAATGALNGTLGATTPSTVVATTISGTDLTTTGNTILGNASTDTLNVGNGGLVKDASGNVGIGVTPSAWSSAYKAVQINTIGSVAADTSSTLFGNNIYWNGSANIYLTTGTAASYLQSSGIHSWSSAVSGTAGNTATLNTLMTLNASGDLLVGATSFPGSSKINVAAVGGQQGIATYNTTAGYSAIYGQHSLNSGTGYVAYFTNTGSSTGLYISNTAAWQSTSDARLKTDVKDLNSTNRLLQLRAVDYLWKSQETSDEPTKRNFGFIAQEVKEIFPELVGVSPDGMFSVEYTGLIAPLVKAIQEQQAMIDELKAKVAALEAA
jgi:hypothetical protein